MHPYSSIGLNGFWKTAVGECHFWDIAGLATPKRKIAPTDLVATAGSCFAQHISHRLRSGGFNFLDAEPPPTWLSAERRVDFGYGMFSARFGNVYTSRQLVQLYQRASGKFKPQEKFWVQDGRYVDPFRPSIEPNGFASYKEAQASQNYHLLRVRRMFLKANVFVFTLGLTETWRCRTDGAVFPVCPGTQAGTFDSEKYEFINLTFADILSDMRNLIRHATAWNPKLHFILTVSPVPLTATASGKHVLTATTYSKSVLRAVAGQLSDELDNVDYFPSYEIISSPAFGGVFFDKNLRSIRAEGVDFVMNTFFNEFCIKQSTPSTPAESTLDPMDDLVLCDEEALEAFAA